MQPRELARVLRYYGVRRVPEVHMIGRWIEALLERFGYIKLTAYRRALLERAPTAPPPSPVTVRPATPEHYAPLTLPLDECTPHPLGAATALRTRRVGALGSSGDWRRTAPQDQRTTVYLGGRRYRR